MSDQPPATLEAALEKQERIELQIHSLQAIIDRREQQRQTMSRTLRIYEFNLIEAQKIIDAAQKELDQISQRIEHRKTLLEHALDLCRQHPASDPPQTLLQRRQRETAQRIALQLKKEIEAETPRLRELQALIAERKAYRERILTVYMPADLAKTGPSTSRGRLARQTTNPNAPEALQSAIKSLQTELQQVEATIARLQATPTAIPGDAATSETAERANQTGQSDRDEQAAMAFQELRGQLPWPMIGEVIYPFGEFTHPQYKITIQNTGIDLLVPQQSKVQAVAPGEVFFLGEMPGMGQSILLDHQSGFMTLYGNIRESVEMGQWVERGEVIALAGASANQEKIICHFSIIQNQKPLNPMEWLADR